VLCQPGVDLRLLFTPVTIRLSVDAVCNDYNWECIRIVHPRPVQEDVVTVFEADRLLIPVELALLEKNTQEVIAAHLELVFLVEVAAAPPFEGVVLDVGIVEDVEAFVAHVAARKAPHEVETVVKLPEGHLLLGHLFRRVEHDSGVVLVLLINDEPVDAQKEVYEEDEVNHKGNKSAEDITAVIADFDLTIQVVLFVAVLFHSLHHAIL
jgi:hypothetical protein